tara:strand:+ start:1141 stop:1302 length:162 start_codon:yes stop_codon:yes gene_type:complete
VVLISHKDWCDIEKLMIGTAVVMIIDLMAVARAFIAEKSETGGLLALPCWHLR